MKMRVAILGAGNIARSMAAAVRGLQERGEDVEPYAVGARELSRAEAFAKEQGFAKAYGSYEELVSDPDVDLVYVATTHSMHYEHEIGRASCRGRGGKGGGSREVKRARRRGD